MEAAAGQACCAGLQQRAGQPLGKGETPVCVAEEPLDQKGWGFEAYELRAGVKVGSLVLYVVGEGLEETSP